MAKFILGLFGWISLIIGGAAIAVGITAGGAVGLAVTLWIAAGALVSGALLVGASQALSLLERIERNTRKRALPGRIAAPSEPADIDPAVTDFMRRRAQEIRAER